MIAYKRRGSGFHVQFQIIWISSLLIGVLASVPKILQMNITRMELLLDCSIAMIYALMVWYFNLMGLPAYSRSGLRIGFFSARLALSLVTGVVLMVLLVGIHHLFYPDYHFVEMAVMYQFRGILINLTIYLFLHLLYVSHHSQQIETELQRSRAEHVGAQFELLKQQVNPHFLFNSLTTLKSMIDIGDEQSSDFVVKLSDFYRFSLEKRKMDMIPLTEELDILNAYMFLLESRFEQGIRLKTVIEQEDLKTLIPPFTLQLLIENCVKHNVISLDQPLGIRIYVTAGLLVVENDVQLKNTTEYSTGTGLENISQRFLHLTGSSVTVEQNELLFTVKLPLVYEHTDHRR